MGRGGGGAASYLEVTALETWAHCSSSPTSQGFCLPQASSSATPGAAPAAGSSQPALALV